jgi:hypothetical protein
MDATTLQKFLSSVHSYKGLEKLNVFVDNKAKNKPLKWWLQQMDEITPSDEPFNVPKFLTSYRLLSSKKNLYSAKYMDEILDWAVENKSKFKTGLLSSKMQQYRQLITKNEKEEQERESELEKKSSLDKEAFDADHLQNFMTSIQKYKGLEKLNMFFENKNLKKPLQWWLKEIDKMTLDDSKPFTPTTFVSKHKLMANKPAIETLDSILDWARTNKLKFKEALENSDLSKYRSVITKKEKQLTDDEKGQIELDFHDLLLDAEDSDEEWKTVQSEIKKNDLKIKDIRRSDENDLGVVYGQISDIKNFLKWYTDGSGLEFEYFDFIEPFEK